MNTKTPDFAQLILDEQERQIARLHVPTIGERARKAMLSLALVKAATRQQADEDYDDRELHTAIHQAAAAAYDELYYLSTLSKAIVETLAPTNEQQRDIDDIRGVEPDPRD